MNSLNGIYLVIDPAMDWNLLFPKLKSALKGGLQIIQIWNHWQDGITDEQRTEFITEIKELAKKFNVPVLMHDDWQLAARYNLDGVHFDEAPEDLNEVRKAMGDRYIGLTVGNELEKIQWADAQRLSYISFCAIFPSSSVDTCTIVDKSVIRRTRETTKLPIFLSGGIKHNNLEQLKDLKFEGIAIISGILSAENPEKAVRIYKEKLNKIRGVKN